MGFNKIPTLREYFEFVKDKNIVTNIELKTGINEYFGIEGKRVGFDKQNIILQKIL